MDQIKTGKFIASLRKEKGLTQMMPADRLGISDKTVSKYALSTCNCAVHHI